MYRDYLKSPTLHAASQRPIAHGVPNGYLYVPISQTIPSLEHSSRVHQDYQDNVIPNRQYYLDQQDSLIYPSELQRQPSPVLIMSQHHSNVRNSRASVVTFSPQLHNSRMEETHFMERTMVLEQVPPTLSQRQEQQYRECVKEMEFRRRLDSVDRKLDTLQEGVQVLSHYPDRDFLGEFEQIMHRY